VVSRGIRFRNGRESDRCDNPLVVGFIDGPGVRVFVWLCIDGDQFLLIGGLDGHGDQSSRSAIVVETHRYRRFVQLKAHLIIARSIVAVRRLHISRTSQACAPYEPVGCATPCTSWARLLTTKEKFAFSATATTNGDDYLQLLRAY
jgi:hypothetical protein